MFPSARLKQLVCPNPQPCARGYFCFFNHDFTNALQVQVKEKVDESVRKYARKRSGISRAVDSSLKSSTETFKNQSVVPSLDPRHHQLPHASTIEKPLKKIRKEKEKDLISSLHPSAIPQIKPNLNSLVPREKRQKALEKIHAEFLRIYQDLKSCVSLAFSDSLKQEHQIHVQSTKLSYSTKVVGVLMRLKKRPKSLDELDVGVDGEWQERTPSNGNQLAHDPIPLEKLEKLVMTREQLINYGYLVEQAGEKGVEKGVEEKVDSAVTSGKKAFNQYTESMDLTELNPSIQICYRCHEKFIVEYPLSDEAKVACTHHWGKRRNLGTLGMGSERVWLCCQGDLTSKGCTQSPHVFINERNEKSCFTTLPPSSENNIKIKLVLAMDCEMGYTTGGFELFRFTCVDWYGDTIIDEIIKPENPILDFNSRFSGIHFIPETAKSFSELKEMISEIACRDTILIGHGLENDLQVLQIYHERIIDTVQLYPHHRGLPFRYSLKDLTSTHLKRFIQEGEHSSIEDSIACLDLVKKKVSDDL